MQNGSVMRSTRLRGPDVWEFRWRDAGADGKRKHRRMVIGSTAQFSDKSSALHEIAALRQKINLNHPHLSPQGVTVSELVNHYRQRELATDHTWKTHSTKVTYQGYLNKWILPRWKNYTLAAIKAVSVRIGNGSWIINGARTALAIALNESGGRYTGAIIVSNLKEAN